MIDLPDLRRAIFSHNGGVQIAGCGVGTAPASGQIVIQRRMDQLDGMAGTPGSHVRHRITDRRPGEAQYIIHPIDGLALRITEFDVFTFVIERTSKRPNHQIGRGTVFLGKGHRVIGQA